MRSMSEKRSWPKVIYSIHEFKTSKLYRLKTDPDTLFQIDYFKGVFAWGYRLNGDGSKEGIPLALLEEVKEPVPYY